MVMWTWEAGCRKVLIGAVRAIGAVLKWAWGLVTPVSIVRFTLIMPLAVPYIGAFYEPVAERSAEYAENMVNLFKGHYGLMVIGVFLSYLWEEHLEKRRVPPA